MHPSGEATHALFDRPFGARRRHAAPYRQAVMIVAFYALIVAVMAGILLFAIVSRMPKIVAVAIASLDWWIDLPVRAFLVTSLGVSADVPDLWSAWGGLRSRLSQSSVRWGRFCGTHHATSPAKIFSPRRVSRNALSGMRIHRAVFWQPLGYNAVPRKVVSLRYRFTRGNSRGCLRNSRSIGIATATAVH